MRAFQVPIRFADYHGPPYFFKMIIWIRVTSILQVFLLHHQNYMKILQVTKRLITFVKYLPLYYLFTGHIKLVRHIKFLEDVNFALGKGFKMGALLWIYPRLSTLSHMASSWPSYQHIVFNVRFPTYFILLSNRQQYQNSLNNRSIRRIKKGIYQGLMLLVLLRTT